VPDYIALNPYLRRYDLTPEQQQQAYDRYVLANAQVGTGAGTTDADMRPNAVSLAMNPVQPDAAPSEMNSPPPALRDVQLAGADEPSPPAASDSAGNGMPPVSETPATDTSAEPDRRSLETIFGYPNYTPMPDAGLPRPAPNYTPMPRSLPARLIPDKPAKIDEARKAGYPASQIVDFLAQSDPNIQIARDAGHRDEEILNHLAPPPSPPSMGRQVLDGVGDAISAIGDAASAAGGWLETRRDRTFGNAAGMPRAIVEHSGIDRVMPSVMPYARKYLPTGDEATNYLRRPSPPWSGIWSEDARKEWENIKDRPKPEVNLPGRWGKIVDGTVEGVLGAALTRTPPNWSPLMIGGFSGAGSALLRDIARRYAQEDGRDSQRSGYSFGDLFNR
jgi:hypothetical protein